MLGAQNLIFHAAKYIYIYFCSEKTFKIIKINMYILTSPNGQWLFFSFFLPFKNKHTPFAIPPKTHNKTNPTHF